MARKLLALIAGYAGIMLSVMLAFTAAYVALGADGAFAPASYAPSGTWIALSLVVGLAAALLGGWLCARIAGETRTPAVLALILFGLGAAFAFAETGKPDPGPRPPSISREEATLNARMPTWLAFVQPVLGAAGVLAGSRLRRRPARDERT